MKNTYSIQTEGKADELLKDIMKRSKAGSFAELCQKAFSLFNAVITHVANGGKVIFRHADGRDEEMKDL